MRIPFTGDQYDSMFRSMLKMTDELSFNKYHSPKFKILLKKIATDGKRSVF